MLALIGFHVFTGCDQVGRFLGKSKLTWWSAFKNASEFELDALSRLGKSLSLPNLNVLEGQLIKKLFTSQTNQPPSSLVSSIVKIVLK